MKRVCGSVFTVSCVLLAVAVGGALGQSGGGSLMNCGNNGNNNATCVGCRDFGNPFQWSCLLVGTPYKVCQDAGTGCSNNQQLNCPGGKWDTPCSNNFGNLIGLCARITPNGKCN